MTTITRTFGKYEVRVSKDYKINIYYVWSNNEKELFQSNMTIWDAQSMMCEVYLNGNEKAINEARNFFEELFAEYSF